MSARQTASLVADGVCDAATCAVVAAQMTECALSMLTALAEEVHNMDKGRRQELVTATSAQWAEIAALAQNFVPERMAAGGCPTGPRFA